MAFMEPQLVFGTWIVIDGPQGTEAIPGDLVDEGIQEYHGALVPLPESLSLFCENRQAWAIKRVAGWGARFSAPGYTDCTPWTVFESQEEAEEFLGEQIEGDE